MAHLDLMGSLVMVLSGFRFGWAKPVPVNPFNLRNPRRADLWISAAGPLSNFGLSIIFALVLRLVLNFANLPFEYAIKVLYAGVWINLALAFFNLLPLFPLDGSHILRNIIPERHGPTLDKMERFSPILLLLLVFSGSLWYIIGPFVFFFERLLVG
jgi:Zn-dependent protease